VEAFVDKKYGGIHLKQKKFQKELDQNDRDLKLLRRQMAHLEKRRAGLLANLDEAVRRHSRQAAKARQARHR